MENEIKKNTILVWKNGIVSFYQVIETTNSFITFRSIKSETVKNYNPEGWRTDVLPVKNSFDDDKTYRRKIGKYGFIKLYAGVFLSVWNDKPQYQDLLD